MAAEIHARQRVGVAQPRPEVFHGRDRGGAGTESPALEYGRHFRGNLEATVHRQRHCRHRSAPHVELGHPGLSEQQRDVAQHVVAGQVGQEVVQAALDAVLGVHLVGQLAGLGDGGLIQQHLEIGGQYVIGQLADGTGRRSDSGPPDHVAPHVLITEEGTYEGRFGPPESGGGGTGTAVMDDGTHLRQQPIVRTGSDHVTFAGSGNVDFRPR
mmetsp:Transcript_10664/g.25112  ORF Transcript_10664/g.25112 Transcript_10664/m.25112 type:complete len:212 (-) Transcript_10664:320-955(-)